MYCIIWVIYFIATTINSTLCNNVYEQFQVSEETGYSPHEYDDLTGLVDQVYNTVLLLICNSLPNIV